MVAGYTPGVPVLGTVSTLGAAIVLIGGYGLILALRRARSLATAEALERETYDKFA
jgi:spermidine/putrescine transport system permease protein